jgi:hypothetical protein
VTGSRHSRPSPLAGNRQLPPFRAAGRRHLRALPLGGSWRPLPVGGILRLVRWGFDAPRSRTVEGAGPLLGEPRVCNPAGQAAGNGR